MSAPPPPLPPLAPPSSSASVAPALKAANYLLLFVLILCLTSAIDLDVLRRDWRRIPRGVLCAMLCQFVLLPLLGFCSVLAFRSRLETVEGTMLLVITSSPGGSYSNWWCSLFNADLPLSIASTAASTLAAAAVLPLNLAIYLSLTYGGSLLGELPWAQLLTSVAIIVSGVCAGLLASLWISRKRCERAPKLRERLSLLGNACGLALIIIGINFSSSSSAPPWSRPGAVYASLALPALLAVPLSAAVASLPAAGLVIYGFMQSMIVLPVLLVSWKAGWTHAPPSAPLLRVLLESWQPTYLDMQQEQQQQQTDSKPQTATELSSTGSVGAVSPAQAAGAACGASGQRGTDTDEGGAGSSPACEPDLRPGGLR
ncbi:hypothetical protein EMIHUDRAFT_120638 [Emiliania huxleyi CCMP1516]|uniref:Uncharacterized protein n=4 Tax=Emiliania huxleyi TaxID=2903 RepID=A0A0D3IFT6_EMIH1|nr:hypothetical protein EMIHUDRAFT_120638 [Emiliania huxleyi CCMP1516]EOD10121.1 hypothetical protein EMIHUDRAFT_120638 [Emiliania huxleyi CCMP1516]|eukprot:XP_005762550.1 hypothetical protein EMIHUDRAFT_120638 [Emiliania huxleyi CCMP1516]